MEDGKKEVCVCVCVCVLRATVGKSVEYEDDVYHQICFDQCKERYH